MNKKIRKIDDPQDYNESGIKDIMEDLENTTKAALDSAPKIKKDQVKHEEDTSKEILYGSNNGS